MYWISIILTINLLFNIVNLVLLTYFRLSHDGRVCSGDYNSEDSIDDYLVIKGALYLVLVFVYWIFVFIFLLYLFVPVCLVCCRRRKLNRSYSYLNEIEGSATRKR